MNPKAAFEPQSLSRLWPLLVLLVSGCSHLTQVGPRFDPASAQAPGQWVAPPPQAHGASLQNLKEFWLRFDDPILAKLIDASQQQSAGLAQAQAAIAQARAAVTQTQSSSLPSLDAQVSSNRAATTFGGPIIYRNLTAANLVSSWELDLFGGVARQQEAAQARLMSRVAGWHAARVSLAAETALAYLELRACERLARLLAIEVTSLTQSEQLTTTAFNAGLQSASTLALAQASVAEAQNRLTRQRASCDQQVKALVALTALPESQLRAELKSREGQIPSPQEFEIRFVPAELLRQRPDLAAAEFEVAQASAEIGVAEATRYPRLTLSGFIGPVQFATSQASISGTAWQIGPVINLPLIDVGGRNEAQREASRVAYEAAAAGYREKARIAVREVEGALVRLAAAAEQAKPTEKATASFRTAFSGAQERYRTGFANLLELEETRRLVLSAEIALSELQKERTAAWIALYRAAGGGWEAGSLTRPPASAAIQSR